MTNLCNSCYGEVCVIEPLTRDFADLFVNEKEEITLYDNVLIISPCIYFYNCGILVAKATYSENNYMPKVKMEYYFRNYANKVSICMPIFAEKVNVFKDRCYTSYLNAHGIYFDD